MILGKPAAVGDFDDVIVGGGAPRVVDVKKDGRLVLRLVTSAVAPHLTRAMGEVWGDIDTIERPSLSRRRAAGFVALSRIQEWRPDVVGLEPVSPTSARMRLANGRVLAQVVSNPVRSFVAGFTVSRFGNMAGPAALTKKHPGRWTRSLPFFRAVDSVLRANMPEVHSRMAERAASHPSWCIPGTALSTVAVNVNYASHYHRDSGDFRDGYSTLSVVEVGDYSGGLFVLPEHRIAVDVRGGDVLLVQSHVDVHGNTPISGTGKRLSFVTYLKHALAGTINAGYVA